MKKKLMLSKGKILFCLILSSLMIQSCKKDLLIPGQGSLDRNLKSINEARQHFDRNLAKSKGNDDLNPYLKTKVPVWKNAYFASVDGNIVLKVPLKFDNIYWVLNEKTRATMPYDNLNYLYFYKDSAANIKTEWVSLFPDSAWAYGNRQTYTGRAVIRDWDGNLLKAYSYQNGERPVSYSVKPAAKANWINKASFGKGKIMSAETEQPLTGLTCWSQPITRCTTCPVVQTAPSNGNTCAPPGQTTTVCNVIGYDVSCVSSPFYPTPESSLPSGGNNSGNEGAPPSGGASGGGNAYPPNTPCSPTATQAYQGPNGLIIPCSWTMPAKPFIPVDDNPDDPSEGNTSYQLTTEDIEIINTVRTENAEADAFINDPTDCYGTNRMGNVKFNGTLEHWIIQFEYLVEHPFDGRREYSIPGSGPTGRRGFADIVNIGSSEIFEIKPETFSLADAQAEVANYVAHAKVSCPPLIGNWKEGMAYTTKAWPHPRFPGKFLKVRLGASGVILYSTEETYDLPQTLPVFMPETYAQKLKNFVQSLAQNTANLEAKIVMYLRQHPEMVTFIKAAAIGVVIATIVEDIATLGAGIADDWASFVIARTMWRLAAAI